ncbi:hypothetical protein ACQKCX_12310, partial [Psychrobacter pacificensis]|uniref:hypothetical protein n=1 Tax=Psychrobacter pacificensis TaxID=112002 RepID=UPI003D08FA04
SNLSVDANAIINELNAAPKGNYDVRLRKAGDHRPLFYLGLIREIIAECHLHLEFALCALV